MKRLLRYEIKRNLLPLAVFTAIDCLIVGIVNSTTELFYTSPPPGLGMTDAVSHFPRSPLLAAPTTMLVLLCAVVPVMQFSFRMKARGADLWYSLPVRREKLLLARAIGGLALVLIPYTAAYWLGFLIIVCRENYFVLSGYPLYYLATLPAGILLFGFYAFLFSRANGVGDGIVCMIAWTLALPLLFLYLSNAFYSPDASAIHPDPYELVPFGLIIRLSDIFTLSIGAESVSARSVQTLAWLIPIAAAEGIGGYAGLLLTARRQKAEDSEQLFSSLWGYKTFLPYFIAMIASLIDFEDLTVAVIWCALLLVGGFIGFVAYRRSFRLRGRDILSLLIAFAVGVLLSVLGSKLSSGMF